MAKSRYRSKGRRKSSKRAAAARKGWRTRRARGTVAHRTSRRGGHRKSAKRVAQGRRLFALMCKRHGGKANYIRWLKSRRRR